MDKIKFCKLKNNISLIQLNNISKKNALSLDVLKELGSIVNQIDNETRVVIIESLCEKVFSSGHDLSELFNSTPEELKTIMKTCSDLMLSINKSDKLFIAEIDGLATAAGLQLASSCDILIASSRSKFSIPGAFIGLYAATPAINLINFLPSKVAFDMLITGKSFGSKEMFDYGMLDKVINYENENEIKNKLREESFKISLNYLDKNIDCFLEVKRELYNI